MIRGLLLAVSLLLVAGCGGSGSGGDAATRSAPAKERISRDAVAHLERTFDELVDTLEHNYVYGRLRRVDWSALRDRYRPRVRALGGVRELGTVVGALLSEIGDAEVVWQSRDERIRAELEYSTYYEGIGIYIAFRERPMPRVIVLDVIPGSPAERSGLLAHDAILTIDGEPVRSGEGSTVASRIRGGGGTPVRLGLHRAGVPPWEVSVTRGGVELSEVELPLRSGVVPGSSVGFLQFPRSAGANVSTEVPAALDRLRQGGRLTGLILDLRIAGSGDFPLEQLLAYFADGALGTVYTASAEQAVTVTGQDYAGSRSVPLAVVVGPDTEGEAEILAAALQAAGRAVLVGGQTPGSVEKEQQFGLVDGSRLWMPVWSYRAPGDREPGVEGVKPDVSVATDWDEVGGGSDSVLRAASQELARGGGRP